MQQVVRTKPGQYVETLGLLAAWAPERVDSPHARRFVTGLSDRADLLGYRIDPFHYHPLSTNIKHLMSVLKARGIRGLLIAPLRSRGIPFNLPLDHFASASLGFTLRQPQLHRVSSDIYQRMGLALDRLTDAGYLRIGFAIADTISQRTAHIMLGRFLVYRETHRSKGQRKPPKPFLFSSETSAESDFQRWLKQERPDVVCSTFLTPLDWLRKAGRQIPQDTGFVHLDWHESLSEGIAGVDQQSENQGAALVDLVDAQLSRGERGIPANPKRVMIIGQWRPGSSIIEA